MDKLKKKALILMLLLFVCISIFLTSSYLSARSHYYELLRERIEYNNSKQKLIKRLINIENSLNKLKFKFEKFKSLDKKLNKKSQKNHKDKYDSFLYLEPLEFLPALAPLLDSLEKQNELLLSELSYLSVNGPFKNIPSIWPANGWITSMYGMRRHPILKRMIFHRGLDIANYSSTPIFATGGGKVTFHGSKGGYGKTIIIDHGNGVTTQYSHLKKTFVKRGTYVKKGGIIASMGSSGRSTGPHIHYEVRINGTSQNPIEYIF